MRGINRSHGQPRATSWAPGLCLRGVHRSIDVHSGDRPRTVAQGPCGHAATAPGAPIGSEPGAGRIR